MVAVATRVTFVTILTLVNLPQWVDRLKFPHQDSWFSTWKFNSKAIRLSTRLRVEIPVSVVSLDRMRPFAEKCLVMIVAPRMRLSQHTGGADGDADHDQRPSGRAQRDGARGELLAVGD